MSKDAVRRLVAVTCALVFAAHPFALIWLGYTYGFDRLRSDDDYQVWPDVAVDVLFWTAVLSSAGIMASMGRWWWLAALVLLPLLCAIGVLAIACGLWIDGTYF
jgi:hypothetical protein